MKKPITMRNLAVCLLLCSLVSAPVGAQGLEKGEAEKTALKGQPVKVGCLFPLTGSGGRYGHDSITAIQIAREDIASSKVSGYPELDIEIRDTRSKTLRAVQIARTFIERDKVRFLCGVVSSSIAMAVTRVAHAKKTFFIGTDHASPRLTEEALHPYYFRLTNGTRQSMRAGALYIKEHFAKKKPLKIAFIGPDYDYGYQAWKDLRYFLDKAGVSYEVTTEVWPKLFETDYSIHVHALLDSKPDIIVNGQWGLDLVTFVKQSKGLGLFDKATFMNFDAGGNFEVLSELGEGMPLGLVLSARHHVNWPDTAENKSFVERFRQRQGRFPSYAAEGAYAGIMAIAEALRIAGDQADNDKIREVLENLKLKLPEDPAGFSSYMDKKSHQIMQVQAIGRTVRNNGYPPAKILLDDWKIYYPPKHWPSHQKMVESPKEK